MGLVTALHRSHRAAIACAGLLTATSLAAQTASQVNPQSFAPPQAQAQAPIVIPESSGPQAPAGAETLTVTLGGVETTGDTPDPALVDMLRAELVGHRVTVAEVFAAAHRLETTFARSGQILKRVVVPPQTLTDGATLHLTVVDGFVESIDTSQLSPRVRRRIAAVLQPLVGVHGLSLKALERHLLLAADTPGVTLRSALAPGHAPGATILTVEATARPVTGFVTADNTLPDALGRETVGVGVDFNSFAGLGEDLYLRASGDPFAGGDNGLFDARPRDRALAAGLIVPIGRDGLLLNIEGTDARTAPRQVAGQPGFDSRFQRLSARVRYPFVRSRAVTIVGEIAFDAQSERVHIVDPVVLPISRDRLRVVRANGELTSFLPTGGVVTADLRTSFGIAGLGARRASDASVLEPLSRQGADADFSKLELSASLDQPLTKRLAFAFRGRAQTSFGDPLVNAEQIGLATTDGLSTFSAGTVLGDAGYVGRGELRVPIVTATGSATLAIAPYAFGAYGGVRFEQPTILERRTTDYSAYGAGIRIGAAGREGRPALSGSFEYGRGHRQGAGRDDDRATFTLIAQF